jgi:hypothetical protein
MSSENASCRARPMKIQNLVFGSGEAAMTDKI